MGRAAHNLNMLMAAQKSAIAGDIVLVSCVGEKGTINAEAKDLYQSTWFRKARQWAEENGIRWYILSAKHGLLNPETKIEPYDISLLKMNKGEREQWGQRTSRQIHECISEDHPLVILAGIKYREVLNVRHHVSVPMEGLGIGQQLAWLNERLTKQLELF